LEKAAREAVEKWVAAGKPLKPVAPAAAEVTWTFELTPRRGIVTWDGLLGDPDRLFDRIRLDYWNRRQPFPPKL
jgi:hypothetical protein